MIKANELRIGNLFQGEKFSISRYGIQSDGITAITGYGIYLLSENDNILDLKPIELNDKTMLKIKGFEQVYNSKYTKIIEMYNPDKMQLIRWTLKKEKKEYTIEINGHYYPHIQFLHQFQNLFFSLFREELVFSTEP